jgi:ABC-2 type transport system permease protein
MGVRELFVAKGLTGVGLAFVQVTLLMAVTGGLAQRPLLVLLALLLGAMLVTGVGFLLASVGRDLLSVMSWGVLAMLVLVIPSIGILLPGLISGWVRVIPSHYLVDTVHRVANFGAGWGDVGINLLALLAFSSALFWLGGAVLKRRFA